MSKTKYVDRKTILKYLYDQLTGNFAGFLIGMSATGLVSRFFETRSIRNLWGIGSKKTVIDKDTFENLEWIISIVFGFIVFEVMTKIVKEKLEKHFPSIKRAVFRFIIQNEVQQKAKVMLQFVHTSRIAVFSAVNSRIRTTLSKNSK